MEIERMKKMWKGKLRENGSSKGKNGITRMRGRKSVGGEANEQVGERERRRELKARGERDEAEWRREGKR